MDRQSNGWIDRIVSELRQVSRATRSIRGMYALYQFVTFRKDVLLQDLRDRWHAVGSEGGLPDFYQTAYHLREYVEREWGKFFRIAQYVEKGIAHYQDAVVLVNEAV